jgi:hypothetical protein
MPAISAMPTISARPTDQGHHRPHQDRRQQRGAHQRGQQAEQQGQQRVPLARVVGQPGPQQRGGHGADTEPGDREPPQWTFRGRGLLHGGHGRDPRRPHRR